jgi:hypothetical protein
VVAPTNEATFGEMPFFSSISMYSPSVVQLMGYLMSPCCSTASFFMASLSGPMEAPSPMTSRVTPWRMSLWPRPSWISESVAQLSMLMKPGETASPLASTSIFPLAPPRLPIFAMRSPRSATSPT